MYAIYGSGGFGRELIEPVRSYLRRAHRENEEIVFIDDEHQHKSFSNIRTISLEEADVGTDCIIAVGDGRHREIISKRCLQAGINLVSFYANDVQIGGDIDIGEGAVFCGRSLVTTSARIGKQFQCNIYSYVAHDCIIGNYVTFAPRVSCNGNVVIGDYAYIGTGAVIRQGESARPLSIGEGAVVGMGAVVTKDVEPGSVVVGNPARRLEVK